MKPVISTRLLGGLRGILSMCALIGFVACGGGENTSSPPPGQTTVAMILLNYNKDGQYVESAPESAEYFGSLRQAGITVIKTRCYHAIYGPPDANPPEGDGAPMPISSYNASFTFEADIPSEQVELAKSVAWLGFTPTEPSAVTPENRGKEVPCLP